MLLGFPFEVWVVIFLEFTERIGYYGTAFMFMTYCTNMLRWSPSAANALINGLYALSPVSACISSGLADGRWGHPYSVVVFLAAYVTGLVLVSFSSFPFMYYDFPFNSSTFGVAVFGIGVVFFATGYGGMKASTNPLMANALSEVYKNNEVTCLLALSQLFRWVYGVANAGALVGIFLPPFLRGLEERRVVIGTVEYTTGYYIGFSFSALSCIVGLMFFLIFYRRFHRSVKAPSFVLWRILACAIRVRWYFATGRIRDDAFLNAHRWDLIDYAGYYSSIQKVSEMDGSKSVMNEDYSSPWIHQGPSRNEKMRAKNIGYDTLKPMLGDLNDVGELPPAVTVTKTERDTCSFDSVWISNAKSTVRVCRSFVALPIYWLITNQFSTNMILQVSAVDLPLYFPPEAFNNVNVVALLVSLLLFDRLLFPFLFADRLPPVRGRVICGFGIMILSMLWSGFVQMTVETRGVYDAEGHYHLFSGKEMLPAGWLVPPYVMQGVASALVDTTVMEVAYVAAPVSMKGVVMALYLMASSLSGFLGLALSPWMRPQNAFIIFFSLAAALSVVAALFYVMNGPSAATGLHGSVLDTAESTEVTVEPDKPLSRENQSVFPEDK